MSQNHGRRRVAKGCNPAKLEKCVGTLPRETEDDRDEQLSCLGKTQGERDEYALRRANSFFSFDVSDKEHVIMAKTPRSSA
eukprot:2069133-Pleurochrysis_carterae.AAC.1